MKRFDISHQLRCILENTIKLFGSDQENIREKITKAYKDGIEAAHRIGKYENCKKTPENPYLRGTPEADAWRNGFGDGTEDFIKLGKL